MAGKGKAQPSLHVPILSPYLSFPLGTMRSPVKYSRQIQMRHVRVNFARRCDFGEFKSRFAEWEKRIPRLSPLPLSRVEIIFARL